MDNKEILAIVPYVPKKKKEKPTDKYFARRRSLYIMLLFLNVAMIFMGFCFTQKYAAAADSDGLFGLIQEKSAGGIYISGGIRFLLLAALTMFISAFTIFCPAVALAFSAYMALKAGLFFGMQRNFYALMLITVFIFFSILYETEIYLSYDKAKYGIKQIFKPHNVISLSVKTIIYVIIIMLYGVAAGFAA
ncbi:MAG: hypothetical protein PHW77_05410 [Eubacteriales bacterium]|nr:hypothetical protein [Eubacteriales bacterium]